MAVVMVHLPNMLLLQRVMVHMAKGMKLTKRLPHITKHMVRKLPVKKATKRLLPSTTKRVMLHPKQPNLQKKRLIINQ